MLHHTISGSGFPLVLLHGFCENSAIWNPIMDHFSESYKVICIDLPGFGGNPPLDKSITIEDMAEHVHKTIRSLGLKNYLIGGHSLGGYVELALAESYPDELNGMIIFHSKASADSDEKKENRIKTAKFIERNGLSPFLKTFVAGLFADANLKRLPQELDILFKITSQTNSKSAIQITHAMRTRKDRTHVLREANYPVLFICGREDNSIPMAEISQQFILPKESIIHILPNVGHLGMYEAPFETGRIIKGFLDRCSPM